MIPGFTKLDKRRFSAEVWPLIKNRVDAIHSNWADVKNGARPLVIKWGYKDESSGEKIILAVSRSDDESDEHWVDPKLLTGGHRL